MNLSEPLVPVTVITAKHHVRDSSGTVTVVDRIMGVILGPIQDGVLQTIAVPQRYCAKCVKKKMEEVTKALIANLQDKAQAPPKRLVYKGGI